MPTARPDASANSAEAATSLPADAEWLLTDGTGGYACGSVDDLARRRYHGLWIVRPSDSARRRLVVAGLHEVVVQADDGGERRTSLLHAHWHDQQQSSPPAAAVVFRARPLPEWTFDVGTAQLSRTVALRPGAPSSVEDGPPLLLVRWQNRGERPFRLVVRPLLGWCDADHLPPVPAFDPTVTARGASWGVRPDHSLPTLWLSVDGVAAFRGEPVVYRGFTFAIDRERGYDHAGDRYAPGVLEVDLAPGAVATAAFALGEPCADPTEAFAVVAAHAEQRFAAVAAAAHPKRAELALGADDFLHRAEGRLGVLAGFPWFGEWGRDVFVALPGLTLARGRADLCAEVLEGALPFLRDGLLPNVYGRTPDDSHYDSCDAALWFSLAVARYADAGHGAGAAGAAGDGAALLAQRLVPALAGIADAYVRGTGLGLHVGGDALLRAGRKDLNATWMDARIAAGPVTPREGLPVEIQALWYALLAFLCERGERRFADLRDRCGRAFVRSFWLPDGYLADRVHDGVPDPKVRPNMLVAAALARSPLGVAHRRGVVATARARLVTPRGLRTLSPNDPDYVARYEGGPEQRDRAYHQGTVWPWLAGFYVEASLRAAAAGEVEAERRSLLAWLDGMLAELDRAGIGHVSEVFDGDEPQRPGGTFAQAWNTGELLRAFDACTARGMCTGQADRARTAPRRGGSP